MSARVAFRADKMFAGTVEERVKELTLLRVAQRLRELINRPFPEQLVGILEMQPVLDEVLPDILRLQRS